MDHKFPDLVSTDWLADQLADQLANPVQTGSLVILDASKHLPAAKRNPRAEFANGHVPGARFLDLASLTDASSAVPDALPTPAQVLQRLSDLGVTAGDRIVLYDDSAVKTSARAWFALRSAGLTNVAILDGGLAKWRAEARSLEQGEPISLPTLLAAGDPIQRKVRSKQQMLANCETGDEQVLDARGSDRVFGAGIDPVHGGQNGRIPGALNLPFGKVFADDGTFKNTAELKTAFAEAGLDLDKPVITTCGSGVTASVLIFALHLIGHKNTALYDGSWQEWSADPATPKAQGPQ